MAVSLVTFRCFLFNRDLVEGVGHSFSQKVVNEINIFKLERALRIANVDRDSLIKDLKK